MNFTPAQIETINSKLDEIKSYLENFQSENSAYLNDKIYIRYTGYADCKGNLLCMSNTELYVEDYYFYKHMFVPQNECEGFGYKEGSIYYNPDAAYDLIWNWSSIKRRLRRKVKEVQREAIRKKQHESYVSWFLDKFKV